MTHVTLLPTSGDAGPLTALAARSHPESVAESLVLARELAQVATPPGSGSTRDLWEALATFAAFDLGVARAIEPHLDARAILAEAKLQRRAFASGTTSWGVFAAEGGDAPLVAVHSHGRWSLTGTKPWCSLANSLDCALVTARVSKQERGLFAVDLRSDGVTVLPDRWHARGLTEIPSGPVSFTDVTVEPVGRPGWYLERPGFAWGGIGVAACWYGGAVGLARSLFERVGATPDLLWAAHLGAVDEQLHSARRALAEAAVVVEARSSEIDPSLLAKRVRATVARACESVLIHASHALGPAPLALDETYAKRVADLELYVRQHHADRDDASLGTALAKGGVAPW
jgi:alkylation response protein AidB-like acyl-CoA dehydrogenase